MPRRDQGLPYGPAERTVCGLLPRCLCLEGLLRLQCVRDGALRHTTLDEPGIPGCKGQHVNVDGWMGSSTSLWTNSAADGELKMCNKA